MDIIYAREYIPTSYTKSIFLAGPTPRSVDVLSWRAEALRLLELAGYDGVVFVPEAGAGVWKEGYVDQVEWEEQCLHLADCILFWVPRKLNTMPAFTTNIEFGVWQNSGKVIFGSPSDAVKNEYMLYYARKLQIPIADTLQEAIQLAVTYMGTGALRKGGEREIPLHVWNTEHFRQWYTALLRVGNRLDAARIMWTWRIGVDKKLVFFWALHVDVYIAEEDRHKINEIVLSRPDIATVVMYYRATHMLDTEVVLVREFRSPGANESGYVWEIPGGSSFNVQDEYLAVAVAECAEETGLHIASKRMKRHETRQVVATMSAHQAHLFSVELTKEEIDLLHNKMAIPHGVVEDTERTYVHVVKVKDILAKQTVDWSMLGMLLSVIVQQEKIYL